MSIELFRSPEHQAQHSVLSFSDLLPQAGLDTLANGQLDVTSANHFLLVHEKQGLLLDPGGTATYNGLFMALSRYFSPKDLRYVAVSHAAPDSLHSLSRWMVGSRTELLMSQQLLPQLAHVCDPERIANRVHGIPDSGALVHCAGVEYLMLSAHFLGYSACLQLYDPISKILFTGPLGASEGVSSQAISGQNFHAHIHNMRSLHTRHIASRKACQLWVNMVQELDIEMLVPQRGAPIKGKEAIALFFDWICDLPCGTDILTQDHFRIPRQNGRAAVIGWERDIEMLQNDLQNGQLVSSNKVSVKSQETTQPIQV